MSAWYRQAQKAKARKASEILLTVKEQNRAANVAIRRYEKRSGIVARTYVPEVKTVHKSFASQKTKSKVKNPANSRIYSFGDNGIVTISQDTDKYGKEMFPLSRTPKEKAKRARIQDVSKGKLKQENRAMVKRRDDSALARMQGRVSSEIIEKFTG